MADIPFTTDPTKVTTANGATLPAASTGYNDPQKTMYAGYRAAVGPGTMSADPAALEKSLELNVLDHWGPGVRPEGGREYDAPWVNLASAKYAGNALYQDTDEQGRPLPKYNQMVMTIAQSFDPFMQKKEMVRPHWWLNRIPRTAYKLFNGTVQETRIYRGGLTVYSGLSDWEDLAPDPRTADPCAPMPHKSYQYAWETRAWSGKKTAWGSDPICLDVFRFTPHAFEQLGWILETGVKFGTDIQNIWNRDMFIYHSVMARRSFVMTSQFRGADSPRFVYEPYCKFDRSANGSTDAEKGADLHAEKEFIDKPFVVIEDRDGAGVEPLNFDVLNIFRKQLERQCPEAAVGRYGSGLMFALAVSEEDVWNHIRGNEEYRKYWIEANPQALIDGWISPTTYMRWTITCDNDQLRFKYIRRIEKYTLGEARHYGYVGAKEFGSTANDGKAVFIAKAVDPEYGGRGGMNGAPIPEANPEYDLAELAIAPVFMNQVFTNQFVPDTPSLGHGTWFGPKKGLNGRWAWFNPQTEDNIEQKIGKFYGIFEIVPKPELSAIYATSFIYRRCAEPLPSRCPAENPRINVTAGSTSTVASAENIVTDSATGVVTGVLNLTTPLLGASAGEQLILKVSGSGSSDSVDSVDSSDSGAEYEIRADIFVSETGTRKQVQFAAGEGVTVTADLLKDAVVTLA